MKRSRILLAVVTAVLALFALAGTAYALIIH